MKEGRRVAAIDMGTNTFHILIVEQKGERFEEIERMRCWVNLAENGLGHFGADVRERIWNTLSEFRELLDKHEVTEVKCVATQGFRSADNGKDILQRIKNNLGIIPEVISGAREAELIYKGIEWIVPAGGSRHLIMDIGGGSTEFILYGPEGIIWSESYKAGVTYLYDLLVDSDPISKKDYLALIHYFDQQLSGLRRVMRRYNVEALIGASGSFEVLESMTGLHPKSWVTNDINISEFKGFYENLLHTSIAERLQDERIPETRAQLIVVAFIFIEYIIKQANPSVIRVSPFAMKEGIVRELLISQLKL